MPCPYDKKILRFFLVYSFQSLVSRQGPEGASHRRPGHPGVTAGEEPGLQPTADAAARPPLLTSADPCDT